MVLLMSPVFWFFLHAAICVIVVALAWSERLWWAAGLAVVGAILGGVVAVVPLSISMAHHSATTGIDAGNAGVFFLCTVPLFPPVGMALGAAAGYRIDRSQGRTWHGQAPPHRCGSCGYDVRRLRGSVCPECGRRLERTGAQSDPEDAT